MSIGVSIFILIDSFENLNEVLLLFSILIVVSLLYFPNNLYAADHFVSSSSYLTLAISNLSSDYRIVIKNTFDLTSTVNINKKITIVSIGNQSIYTSKNISSAFRIAKNGLKYWWYL